MDHFKLPKLYAMASTGKIKYWRTEALLNEDGFGILRTSHGYLDGKIQVNDKVIKKGKNIGRSNETTPFQQAISEAKSKWNGKIDKNYQETIPKPGDKPRIQLPTHGLDYKHRGHDIIYPCYGQPKLNGVRSLEDRLMDGNINFISNGGKSYNHSLMHLVEPLKKLMIPGDKFDGEVYRHGWLLQRILSATKKLNEDTPKLQFWMFDIADDNSVFSNRLSVMNSIGNIKHSSMASVQIGDLKSLDMGDKINIVSMNEVNDIPEISIIITPTYKINDKSEMHEYHDIFGSFGFEGIMLKNENGMYIFSGDNKDIQKYKEFLDEEFLIIGGVSGEGLEEGCVIFICENEDGIPFKVRPRGGRDLRRDWMEDLDNIIGKYLTVRFKERTADNLPVPPVGIAIREKKGIDI